MENKLRVNGPKYQQIAADIASKIAEGKYQVGDKIYARSSLASQYGVSSETARRAICVLSDLQIVSSNPGSGVIITSVENALKFIKQYTDIQTVNNLRQNIIDSVERQKQEIEYFYGCLSDLIDKTDRFRSLNPFVPFELEITQSTPYLLKSAAEVNFWHHTSATIIAIKRKGELLLSPGPYATFKEEDILYFLGDEDCLERVKNFMYPNAK